MRILDKIDNYLDEGSTENAKKSLDAIIGASKKGEVYDMAMGMKKTFEKNKGFSPDQAKWIWKMSKAMFKG